MARFKVSVSPQTYNTVMLAFFKPKQHDMGKGVSHCLRWYGFDYFVINFLPHRRGIEYVPFCKVLCFGIFLLGIKPMCSSTACLNPPQVWN